MRESECCMCRFSSETAAAAGLRTSATTTSKEMRSAPAPAASHAPPRLTVPRLSFFPLLSREVVSSVLPLSSLCLPRAAAVRSAYPSK